MQTFVPEWAHKFLADRAVERRMRMDTVAEQKRCVQQPQFWYQGGNNVRRCEHEVEGTGRTGFDHVDLAAEFAIRMHLDLQDVVEQRCGRCCLGERAAALSQCGCGWGDNPDPHDPSEPVSPCGFHSGAGRPQTQGSSVTDETTPTESGQ